MIATAPRWGFEGEKNHFNTGLYHVYLVNIGDSVLCTNDFNYPWVFVF